MKIWQVIIALIILASLPVLTSCEMLGIGGKSKQQKAYETQLKMMQEQQAASQKAQDEYIKSLQQSLQKYMDEYNSYMNSQQQAQIQALEQQQQQQAQEQIPYN
jgi:hypothetical protein